jgi:DNA-binding response OmpR family regulator
MSPICLIGESDPFLARLLARFCEASGLFVLRAQVGEEFAALARREHPDLMILDAELPGEQRGWEAAQALRAEANGRLAPIIACSWLPRPDALALMSGCAAYLQKPELHYDDFVTALREAGFEPAQS